MHTQFHVLVSITVVDSLHNSNRFELNYELLSLKFNNRLRIKVYLNELSFINSCEKLFPAATWYECEVWDMFGVYFTNHKNLKRILTDYGFEGHPLRKDFPLTGHSEVRYSEDQKKVISEPVKLEQNYRNFDYESPWEGTKYIKEEIENNDKKN